jgi:hypothetical protein
MLLRDTELIGKKLVKYGFSRSNTDNQNYIFTSYPNVMTVHFVRYSGIWLANRWCEILDLPITEKQRMLEIESPLLRLSYINALLTSNHKNLQG